MTIVASGPGMIACSFTDAVVKVERAGHRTVYFDFSHRFGPLFTDKHGRPLKNQPMPGSQPWEAFEEWHRQHGTEGRGLG